MINHRCLVKEIHILFYCKITKYKSNSASLKPVKDSSASLKSTKKLVVPCRLNNYNRIDSGGCHPKKVVKLQSNIDVLKVVKII